MQTPRYHVIFDLSHAGETIRDPERLKTFAAEIVDAVHMKILSGPVVCEGVPENPGLSCFAVLDYSHVSIHTFTKYDEVLIDVFSCKPFSVEDARKVCMNFFATPETEVREKKVWWGADMSSIHTAS